MRTHKITAVTALLVLTAFSAAAQDSQSWLEAQGLEAADTKTLDDFEVVVARVKGTKASKDVAVAQERVVVFLKGKPVWQSNAKENEATARWKIHALGRDLDGDGQPDLHLSAVTGGANNCCTTHYVYRLKPQVKRSSVYAANSVGASDFIDLPGRKTPVMVSADDSSANRFAPAASSYFPAVILEATPKGRFQIAKELMRTALPGQPPPICTQAAATANAWLKERCGDYVSSRRTARIQEIKTKLASVKQGRAAEQVKWEDYLAAGVLVAIAAEVNRYAYTGHSNAGMSWLESVWPGNESVKVKLVSEIRQTWAKSAFAEDLKGLAVR
jgi:hypothetical protein